MMEIFLQCALGPTAEIEALKKTVAEAERKAAAEQVLYEKHEARVMRASRGRVEMRDLGAKFSRE